MSEPLNDPLFDPQPGNLGFLERDHGEDARAACLMLFQEQGPNIPPVDSAENLERVTADTAASMAWPGLVHNGFTGPARRFSGRQALVAQDPRAATFLARSVTVQAIVRWDRDDQARADEPGTLVSRGLGTDPAQLRCFHVQLRAGQAPGAGVIELAWEAPGLGLIVQPGADVGATEERRPDQAQGGDDLRESGLANGHVLARVLHHTTRVLRLMLRHLGRVMADDVRPVVTPLRDATLHGRPVERRSTRTLEHGTLPGSSCACERTCARVPWPGRPPRSRPRITEWAAKIAREARAGAEIVALLPCRVNSAWLHDYVFPTAAAICYWRGYLRVLDERRKSVPTRAVFYWGPRTDKFRRAFASAGTVVLGGQVHHPDVWTLVVPMLA